MPWCYSATYILPMPFIFLVFLVMEWIGRNKECPIKLGKLKRFGRWVVYVLLVALIFVFGESSESFIYFQF